LEPKVGERGKGAQRETTVVDIKSEKLEKQTIYMTVAK